MSDIVFKDVTFFYINNKKDAAKALDHLSTTFKNGEVSILYGPSGSGKTSLLRCLLGLESYDGNILINGVEVEGTDTKERKMSYVSQEITLYPHLDIFHNIANPLTFTSASNEEIRERVFRVAKMLDIVFLLFRKPRELSLGQAQMVAIARAMVKEPQVYLFDEPFSNLDPKTKSEIIIKIKTIFKQLNATVIMATHNVDDVINLGDQVFLLEQGRVIDTGTPIALLRSGKLK